MSKCRQSLRDGITQPMVARVALGHQGLVIEQRGRPVSAVPRSSSQLDRERSACKQLGPFVFINSHLGKERAKTAKREEVNVGEHKALLSRHTRTNRNPFAEIKSAFGHFCGVDRNAPTVVVNQLPQPVIWHDYNRQYRGEELGLGKALGRTAS